jgi:C4-dicarboxylate transporter DctM subunit
MITAIIFAIIAMATFLSVVLTYTQAPQKIINFFLELGGTQVTFWISVAVICLILGTFVEIVPVFYLTVPIFAALALSLNLHVLHLYIVFVAFAGIGMITPPVCVGIYTAAGVAKESPEKAFKEVPLFIFMGIVFGTIMILFPALATWLPSTMNQM